MECHHADIAPDKPAQNGNVDRGASELWVGDRWSQPLVRAAELASFKHMAASPLDSSSAAEDNFMRQRAHNDTNGDLCHKMRYVTS